MPKSNDVKIWIHNNMKTYQLNIYEIHKESEKLEKTLFG